MVLLRRHLALLTLLVACKPASDKPADDTSSSGDTSDTSDTSETASDSETADTTETAAPPLLSDVSPAWGLTTGGAEVTLHGSGFTADDVVKFGVNVATVEARTADTMVVLAPATGTAATVDVTVQGPGGEAALPGVFTYYPDATGKKVLFGAFVRTYSAGPYLGAIPESHTLTVALITPTAFEFGDRYAPAIGTCENNYTPAALGTLDPGLAQLTFTGPGDPLVGDWVAPDVDFESRNVPDGVWVPGATYDLGTVTMPGLPPFTFPDALETPLEDLTVDRPGIEEAEVPTIPAGDISFQWGGTPGSGIILVLARRTLDGTAFDIYVTCHVPDTGAFTVPADVFPSWEAGRAIDVEVGRYVEAAGTRDVDHGGTAFVGMEWEYGGFFTR